jgi:hypothetical protein
MPLRLRRGTDSTRTSITPIQGEPIYTTDTKKLFIGDGTTAGGVEIGGTTVSNSGDNRVITSDGTSTGLVAESNLSFNGTQLTVTGSIIATSLTGSLQGSSSYSNQSLSSSFATNSSTASYVLNAVSASFATNSSTASYVLNAVSSSFSTNASTASYVLNSVSSSFATTASFSRTSSTSSYVLNAVSASFATTASYVLGGGTTVTNSGNDRIITSDGTTDGLVGETNLLFNGSNLSVTGSVIASSFTGSLLYFEYDAGTNINGGIGIGNECIDNYDFGIGIGYQSGLNYQYGVGIGSGANNNYESGIGIGNAALENYTEGVGIGIEAGQNYLGGVGIGAGASSNGLGYGTIAMGAYSIAQRQNEFVTTATNSTANKAQSIIQKFRNISLASSGGVNQEIYTDASSARVTIQPSSVYQFRIQINAIQSTSVICKTWEVVGAIKRNASNTTSMIGTPIYTVTSEDSGTTNWDVTVDADDTNEALRILVKHDAINNVTFSATVWATETRL